MAKYLYNDYILPALREWDKTSYPYVYIHRDNCKAYATSAPLSVVVVTSFFTSATATLDAPFLCSTFKVDENNREYWTEWETVTESTETKMYKSGWSNYDILDADGNVFFSATDPVLVNSPIVAFDGEAVTEQTIAGIGFPADTLMVADRLAIGDKVRITLDGISAEYEVKKVPTSTQSLIGNAGLNGNDTEAEDDGGDWLIAAVPFEGMGYRRIYFYTRTEGTHQLKIELLSDKPESALTERDLYRKINGQPTKLTLYKKVSGELVPLDEYTQGGNL